MSESRQVNVRLPEAAHAALGAIAATRGSSISALVVEAVERLLRSPDSGLKPEWESDWSAYQRLAGDMGRLHSALEDVDLSTGEASAICDARNGAWLLCAVTLLPSSAIATHIYADVLDTPGLAEKWSIELKALLRKIKAWTPVQACAVADAVQLFWRFAECDTGVALRAVGLVR